MEETWEGTVCTSRTKQAQEKSRQSQQIQEQKTGVVKVIKSRTFILLQPDLFQSTNSEEQNELKLPTMWFCRKMRAKVLQLCGSKAAGAFKASSNWFHGFKKRNRIAYRSRTNIKKVSSEEYRVAIQLLHRYLRKAVQSVRRRNALHL